MSVFDDIEDAALGVIITGDRQTGALYRLAASDDDGNANDGFNSEYERSQSYLRQIDIAIARSGSGPTDAIYTGTTNDTGVLTNDVIEVINQRGDRRLYVVRGLQPVKGHTILDLDEVRDGA